MSDRTVDTEDTPYKALSEAVAGQPHACGEERVRRTYHACYQHDPGCPIHEHPENPDSCNCPQGQKKDPRATEATFYTMERITVIMSTRNPDDRKPARYLEPSHREKNLHYVWYDDQSSGLVHEGRIRRAE